MRLTFEGNTMRDILDQIEDTLRITGYNPEIKPSEATKINSLAMSETGHPYRGTSKPVAAQPEGPGPELQIIPEDPVDKPVDKPVEKPVAAKPKKAPAPKKVEPVAVQPAKELTPAELAAIQKKTVEELQAAYAGGKQEEVFALLSQYGNGAKSFRELTMDAFVPIREAIDNGALS